MTKEAATTDARKPGRIGPALSVLKRGANRVAPVLKRLGTNRLILGGIAGVLTAIVAQPFLTRIDRRMSIPPVEIERLIEAEARLASTTPRTQASIDEYVGLFTTNAWIADDASTTDGPWIGANRIRQRISGLNELRNLSHGIVGTIEVAPDGTSAWARTRTTFDMGGTSQQSHEEWLFVRSNGRWRIRAFTFNVR